MNHCVRNTDIQGTYKELAILKNDPMEYSSNGGLAGEDWQELFDLGFIKYS